MFSISACLTPTDRKRFETLPEKLHQRDPSYTPPFPGSIAKFLDPSCSYQRQHGEILPFIAWRDGRPVGRIAAVINRSHNKYYGDRTGFFGFFDCEDDPVAATALFDTAAAALVERGCDLMRGPYNPSVNEECGLLFEGFDGPPFISMPWNPAYYEPLYLGAGLTRVRELAALLLDLSKPMPDRVKRIMERMTKRSGITLRSFRLDRLDEELEILYRLYNCTLDRNWGFVPITLEDFQASADDLRAIVDTRVIQIAEVGGKAAAFAISLPNINEHLHRLKRWPRWLRPLGFLLLLKLTRPKDVRLAVLGVAPEFRDRGISAMLFYEQYVQCSASYRYNEISWVEANNHEILQNTEMMNGQIYRKYGIYERPLAATVPGSKVGD